MYHHTLLACLPSLLEPFLSLLKYEYLMEKGPSYACKATPEYLSSPSWVGPNVITQSSNTNMWLLSSCSKTVTCSMLWHTYPQKLTKHITTCPWLVNINPDLRSQTLWPFYNISKSQTLENIFMCASQATAHMHVGDKEVWNKQLPESVLTFHCGLLGLDASCQACTLSWLGFFCFFSNLTQITIIW